MRASILVLIFVGACTRTDPTAADSAARLFVKNIPGTTGLECARTDSDGDGYCSCTVFRGTEEPMQIACGCEAICIWNCVRGCKYEPAMKFNRPRRGEP